MDAVMTPKGRSHIKHTLSLVPVTLSNLPSIDVLIRDGRAVIDASTAWKGGKTFGDVATSSHIENGHGPASTWYCRVSKHRKEDVTFDELWEQHGKNKKANEKRFNPMVKEATLIECISEWESIWSIYCVYPPPLSPRVFTELVVCQLNEYPTQKRTGITVSIPVDISSAEGMTELEEKGVRARRIRVEVIEELNNGMIEWRMVTCEDIGGVFPRGCAQRRIPRAISKEVSFSLKWLRGLPTKGKSQKDGTRGKGKAVQESEHV